MSKITKIHTDNAPAAVGPYSQAIAAGGVLYTSGQIALDPATGEIVGDDIKAQAEQVMKNLAAVLAEAGTSQENVIKTTCFLKDMADFGAFNEVYGAFFTEKPFPSNTPSNARFFSDSHHSPLSFDFNPSQ